MHWRNQRPKERQLLARTGSPPFPPTVQRVVLPACRITGRRLPPFAKEVIAARSDGGPPSDVVVFAGQDAWKRANIRRRNKGRGTALVLPPGEKPEDYAWPVRGLLPLVVWPDGDPKERVKLGAQLVAQGARLALVLEPGRAPTWVEPE